MKILLVLSITIAAAIANADDIWTVNGKEVTKGEAVRAAATDPNAKIKHIIDVKLSDKGTLVKK